MYFFEYNVRDITIILLVLHHTIQGFQKWDHLRGFALRTIGSDLVRWGANSSGDRVIAIENIQSLDCALAGIHHDQDPSRTEVW